MSLRDRILIMVSFLVIFMVLVTAAAANWSARQSLLEQTEADVEVIAQVMARSLTFAQDLPAEVNAAISAQMAEQVGEDAVLLEKLAEKFGVARLADSVVGGGDVLAVHVLDLQQNLLASSVLPGAQVSPELSHSDRDMMEAALQGNQTVVQLTPAASPQVNSWSEVVTDRINRLLLLRGATLRAAAPLGDVVGEPLGVLIIYLPTDQIQISILRQIWLTVILALAALVFGVEASFVLARRLTRPVALLRDAALAVEAGTFDPQSLGKLSRRRDEMGKFAKVFTRMALEVRAREQNLIHQVQELSIEIDEVRKKRQVEEITDTEYFRELQERASQLRRKDNPAQAP